jgi:8-oxo-dGTP pyrophosphatase MutT (NUDIX family)
MISKILLSIHAQEQMRERNITEKEVKAAIKGGKIISKDHDGILTVQDSLLRVVYEPKSKTTANVITVIRKSTNPNSSIDPIPKAAKNYTFLDKVPKSPKYSQNPQNPTQIKVVLAIIQHDGQYLIQFNKPHNFYALPGGKIKPDEDPLQALKREMMEELGIQVTQTRKLIKSTSAFWASINTPPPKEDYLFHVYKVIKYLGPIENVLPSTHPVQEFMPIQRIRTLLANGEGSHSLILLDHLFKGGIA